MKFQVTAAVCVVMSFWGAFEPGAAAAVISPIYGLDDRRDLFQVSDPALLGLADSTVALIDAGDLAFDPNNASYWVLSSDLGSSKKLCEGEAFADQPALANCSGSLVGPDLVLTAGHCIKNEEECRGTHVAFGFSLKKEGESRNSLPVSEVFNCQEIVGRAQDPDGADFAVIRLDRPVSGHTPLKINRMGDLAVGTPLVVMGHPSGLPTKIAGGARVRDISDEFKFIANLDTYGGNSGSPVFNVTTGLIEGILVSGELDYVFDEERGCTVNHVCDDDGCRGEKSTRVSAAAGFIPEI